jgi:hypothetical protein
MAFYSKITQYERLSLKIVVKCSMKCVCVLNRPSMDQISIKTPNPKYRLFLKFDCSKVTWKHVFSVRGDKAILQVKGTQA